MKRWLKIYILIYSKISPHILTLIECISDAMSVEDFLKFYTSSDLEISTPANLLKRLLDSKVSMHESFVSVS